MSKNESKILPSSKTKRKPFYLRNLIYKWMNISKITFELKFNYFNNIT